MKKTFEEMTYAELKQIAKELKINTVQKRDDMLKSIIDYYNQQSGTKVKEDLIEDEVKIEDQILSTELDPELDVKSIITQENFNSLINSAILQKINKRIDLNKLYEEFKLSDIEDKDDSQLILNYALKKIIR